MAGYKVLKRKGVDQVSDDFSDFSLSSPATKIRRLDAELPPIAEVEEEQPPLPLPITQAEETPNPNEERAIVLFKPLSHSPSSSSSSFSLTLHSDLISEIKNWSKQCDSDCGRLIRSQQEEDKNDHHLALVPWVPSPSQFPHVHDSNNTNTEIEFMEEADEMGEASMMMDIEEQEEEDTTCNTNNSSISTIHPSNPTTLNLHHGIIGGITATPPEGFHQWQQQQQHCLLPQLPQNTSTPITWTR